MQSAVLNKIIDDLTGEPGRDYVYLSRTKIVEIARAYAKTDEVKETFRDELFGAGYKSGYTERSDEIYDLGHSARWDAHVNELKGYLETEFIEAEEDIC